MLTISTPPLYFFAKNQHPTISIIFDSYQTYHKTKNKHSLYNKMCAMMLDNHDTHFILLYSISILSRFLFTDYTRQVVIMFPFFH